jgi:hypothetical protein
LACFSNIEAKPLELARAAGRLDELMHLRRQILTYRGKEPRE